MTSPQRDVQTALNDWKIINEDPRRWASFESIQFSENYRVVRVTHGRTSSLGVREQAIGTFNYGLDDKGEVWVHRATHL